MPSRRHVTPRGWAVGVPYSAATARTSLRVGAVPQSLCAAPSRGCGRTYPHTALSRAGSPAACGWSGRPSPSWSPLLGGRQTAALPVWTFFAAQRLGKAATCVLRWSFCPQARKDTSIEQYVGRLSHDRTTVRHWQQLRPVVPAQPQQPTPRLPGCCAIIISPFLVEVDQAGAGYSRCVVGTV